MPQSGMQGALVLTDGDNIAARALYKSAGGKELSIAHGPCGVGTVNARSHGHLCAMRRRRFRFIALCSRRMDIRMVQERFEGKANIFMRDGDRFFLFLGEGGQRAAEFAAGRLASAFRVCRREQGSRLTRVRCGGPCATAAGITGHWLSQSQDLFRVLVYDPDGNNIEAIYRIGLKGRNHRGCGDERRSHTR